MPVDPSRPRGWKLFTVRDCIRSSTCQINSNHTWASWATDRLLTAGLLCLIRSIGTLRFPITAPTSWDALAVQAGELSGGTGFSGCSETQEHKRRSTVSAVKPARWLCSRAPSLWTLSRCMNAENHRSCKTHHSPYYCLFLLISSLIIFMTLIQCAVRSHHSTAVWFNVSFTFFITEQHYKIKEVRLFFKSSHAKQKASKATSGCTAEPCQDKAHLTDGTKPLT